MTNQHFKTDNVDHGYSYQQAEYQGRSNGSRDEQKRREEKEKERQRRRERQAQAASAVVDEEEELRRAIELSKQTAAKEEQRRVNEVIGASKSQPQGSPSKEDDEFNFGSGFEKFSTNNKPVQGDNVNDFDFGSDVIQPKGKQDAEEFDFNFAGGSAAPQKKEEPQS